MSESENERKRADLVFFFFVVYYCLKRDVSVLGVGKNGRKIRHNVSVSTLFAQITARGMLLSFCGAVVVATNTCCGVRAGSDALSAYGRILSTLLSRYSLFYICAL